MFSFYLAFCLTRELDLMIPNLASICIACGTGNTLNQGRNPLVRNMNSYGFYFLFILYTS
jgi:hypothetical protein